MTTLDIYQKHYPHLKNGVEYLIKLLNESHLNLSPITKAIIKEIEDDINILDTFGK